MPVPIDPKLVSFHAIEKCQTFFTCKISWLVESIESDWGRQLLRGSGQVWNSNWPPQVGALQNRLAKSGEWGQLPPPPPWLDYNQPLSKHSSTLSWRAEHVDQWGQNESVEGNNLSKYPFRLHEPHLQHMDQLTWVLTKPVTFQVSWQWKRAPLKLTPY